MGRGKGIMVTNDGATILKSIYVDNAAAKVLVGERCRVDGDCQERSSCVAALLNDPHCCKSMRRASCQLPRPPAFHAVGMS